MTARRICRLCEKGAISPTMPPSFDLCATCAGKLGVMPLPPSRRPPVPCHRCNGMRFVRAIPRSKLAGDRDPVAPTPLTFVPVSFQLFGLTNYFDPSPQSSRGRLETYVCVGCGFVEWYCFEFESIPLGPEYMTEFVDYGSPGTPYR
jgi:hypothetical protein